MIKLKIAKNKQKEMRSIRDDYSRGEVAKEILKGLAIGGVIAASFALPNLLQVLAMFDARNSKDRFKIRRNIDSLRKQKLINIYEKDGKEIMEITENGKKRVLRYKFDEMRIERPKKWDGYWRVVIFDIPERYKKGRDALTRKLREMEIYPLQKSVFVCPFECRDEIDFTGEFFNIRKFIYYFLAKEIDGEGDLKRHYNL